MCIFVPRKGGSSLSVILNKLICVHLEIKRNKWRRIELERWGFSGVVGEETVGGNFKEVGLLGPMECLIYFQSAWKQVKIV